MFQKRFQLFLVVFVALFTTAAVVLLTSFIASLFMRTHTDGASALTGGFSASLMKLIVAILGLVMVVVIYKLTRSKLR